MFKRIKAALGFANGAAEEDTEPDEVTGEYERAMLELQNATKKRHQTNTELRAVRDRIADNTDETVKLLRAL